MHSPLLGLLWDEHHHPFFPARCLTSLLHHLHKPTICSAAAIAPLKCLALVMNSGASHLPSAPYYASHKPTICSATAMAL